MKSLGRRSITGVCIFWRQCLLKDFSKTQQAVTLVVLRLGAIQCGVQKAAGMTRTLGLVSFTSAFKRCFLCHSDLKCNFAISNCCESFGKQSSWKVKCSEVFVFLWRFCACLSAGSLTLLRVLHGDCLEQEYLAGFWGLDAGSGSLFRTFVMDSLKEAGFGWRDSKPLKTICLDPAFLVLNRFRQKKITNVQLYENRHFPQKNCYLVLHRPLVFFKFFNFGRILFSFAAASELSMTSTLPHGLLKFVETSFDWGECGANSNDDQSPMKNAHVIPVETPSVESGNLGAENDTLMMTISLSRTEFLGGPDSKTSSVSASIVREPDVLELGGQIM